MRLYGTVVVYCYTNNTVMTRFLLRADDHNMTNGDFAFFTYRPLRSARSDRPWDWYARYLDDRRDRSRLRQAYAVVKQVLYNTWRDSSCSDYSDVL